jgi:catechol 2,3-dioxygenase-like lactoylglutathione lyase family enzyme
MPTIRHIAIYTDDMEAQARFYREAFGMEEMRSSAGAISLTDGYLGVTLIKTSSDSPKKGLHHFGFLVEDLSAAAQRLQQVKPGIEISKPEDFGTSAEYKVKDPEGNIFDITERGWIRYDDKHRRTK